MSNTRKKTVINKIDEEQQDISESENVHFNKKKYEDRNNKVLITFNQIKEEIVKVKVENKILSHKLNTAENVIKKVVTVAEDEKRRNEILQNKRRVIGDVTKELPHLVELSPEEMSEKVSIGYKKALEDLKRYDNIYDSMFDKLKQ